MSTSPRIDSVLGRLAEQGRELSERSCPQALVDEARRIEIELTAAKERIQRLENAGGAALDHAADSNWLRAVAVWEAAKESKP